MPRFNQRAHLRHTRARSALSADPPCTAHPLPPTQPIPHTSHLSAPQKTCAGLGCAALTWSFLSGLSGVAGARYVLTIGFAPGAGYLMPAGTQDTSLAQVWAFEWAVWKSLAESGKVLAFRTFLGTQRLGQVWTFERV
eukprot:285154-Chlamydomonas_euryale.AAC.7